MSKDYSRMSFGELMAECERLDNLINTPHIEDFLEAVRLEAAHQAERWGSEHDAGKGPVDWLFLVAYLAGKASAAATGAELPLKVVTKAVDATWERFRQEIESGKAIADQCVVCIGCNAVIAHWDLDGPDENLCPSCTGTSFRRAEPADMTGDVYGVIVGGLPDGFDASLREHIAAELGDKALHHTITAAAALLNWHSAMKKKPLNPLAPMRPGTDTPTDGD